MNTQINIWIVLFIIFIHWIADFLFQDEKWAITKSKNFRNLILHTATYSAIWFPISMMLFKIVSPDQTKYWYFQHGAYFFYITFILHTITDYYTSRLNSKLYEKKKFGGPIPNWGFFSSIGLDQVYHYVQLFLTFQLLLML